MIPLEANVNQWILNGQQLTPIIPNEHSSHLESYTLAADIDRLAFTISAWLKSNYL